MSNYSSWGTPIHSEHTCIVLKMCEKLENEQSLKKRKRGPLQVWHEWVRTGKTVGF